MMTRRLVRTVVVGVLLVGLAGMRPLSSFAGPSGSVTGSGTPITATEDQTFGGLVATFTDSNMNDTASTFTARIDWGDGTVNSGTVSGGSGNFAVSGLHRYADEGTFSFTVTLSYAATGSAAAVAQSTASVAEGDNIFAYSAPTPISATEGQSFTGVVARFSDTTYVVNPPEDFTAAINWGDGTTSRGVIAGDPSLGDGGYKIIGSHTWSQDDTYTVTVSLADNPPGTAGANGIESTATVGESNDFSAQGGDTLNLQEGVVFSGTVATFADTGSADSPSAYTASIDWGDGTAATAGTISGSAGSYSVSGNHVYADEGTYTITVTISESGADTRIRATSTAMVNETDSVTGHILHLALVEGQKFSGPIALFSDTNVTNTVSDFTALIIWGDGSATSGTISGGNGFFIVSGSHTYSDEGTFPVSVILSDDGEGTATGTARANVTVAEADSLSGSLVSLHPAEGRSFSGAIATFSDANTANIPADFRATISWGDGTSATGMVSGGGGHFTVSGSHTYADEGSYAVSVTLTDDSPGTARSTAAGTVTVAEADSITGSLASVHPTEGQPFSGAVATFADTNIANVATDFRATIRWGDGSSSSGVVTGGSGRFTVSGTHAYADEGSYPLSVTLQDDAPGTASARASGSVSVAEGDQLAGIGTSAAPIAGTSYSGAVATFSDTNRSNTAQDFLASINWGDGTTSSGSVSGSNGHLTVSGSHTYSLPGRYTVQTTIRDDTPGTASATTTTTLLVMVPASSNGITVEADGTTACTSVASSAKVTSSGSPSGTFAFRDERPGGSPCGGYHPGVLTLQGVGIDAVVCTSHSTVSIYGRAKQGINPSTTASMVSFRADVAITSQSVPFDGTVRVQASSGYSSGAVPASIHITGC